MAEREPTRVEAALLKALGYRHLPHTGWLHRDGCQVGTDGELEAALDEACAEAELGHVELVEVERSGTAAS